MLHSANELALSDGDLSAAMASMLERTNRIMSDFHVLKEQMVRYDHFALCVLWYDN